LDEGVPRRVVELHHKGLKVEQFPCAFDERVEFCGRFRESLAPLGLQMLNAVDGGANDSFDGADGPALALGGISRSIFGTRMVANSDLMS
jgi:hypothetical protein